MIGFGKILRDKKKFPKRRILIINHEGIFLNCSKENIISINQFSYFIPFGFNEANHEGIKRSIS